MDCQKGFYHKKVLVACKFLNFPEIDFGIAVSNMVTDPERAPVLKPLNVRGYVTMGEQIMTKRLPIKS